MGLPKVHVSFTEAAKTFVTRADIGIVGLILRDSIPAKNPVEIINTEDIPDTLTEANKKQLELAIMGAERAPKKVVAYVISPNEEGGEGEEPVVRDYQEAFDYFNGVTIDYLAVPDVLTDDRVNDVVTWVTTARADGRTVKAVLPNTASDNVGIINFATNSVVDDDITYSAAQYCARIAGMLASIPITESATYKALYELTGCEKLSKAAMDEAIDAGKLIVFWDGEKVKIARGVNSFQTTTATMGAQFKKIRIIEIMDTIQSDIKKLAEDYYIGRFSNSYANKCILLSAIGDYLNELQNQQVIRVINCDIDEAANRKYLISKGIDVSEMSDTDIREANTDDKVFLTATLSLYDAIEDIILPITV